MTTQEEVLQVSSLEDYEWPENDPHSVSQRTRKIVDADRELIQKCVQGSTINMEAFLKNQRREGRSKEETILGIITHQKFQMNPVALVRQEPQWIFCIQHAISKNIPIDIVYPQCCVIPNAPKRYTNIGTAAGEDCMIEFFKLINNHVKNIYAPGIRFLVLADAALYASAFQTHQTEVDAYYESVENRIKQLNASDCIILYDYSELLRTKCHPDYQIKYYEEGHKVWPSNLVEILPNIDVETLRRSVRCSVNTRRFQLGHLDHLQLFGPSIWRTTDHPYFQLIETMTDIALREVITIRMACQAIDISSRLWPNAIRATCHKGQKNGHWALGLRPYPEYYGSCKILPYHGMPIITRDSKNAPKLEIAPEVLLRGRTDMVRVTFDKVDEVYAYVDASLDKDIVGETEYDCPIGMRDIEFERNKIDVS